MTKTASPCSHERSSIIDSAFYGHRYSTKASHRIFCDQCRFQRWLDVEAALALEQGKLGIIPMEAATQIAAAADIELLDLNAVAAEIQRTRHSIVGLLRVFQGVCAGGSGEFVHYGATTQDIQDTSQSLEMRDVLDELDTVLALIITRLADLAEENAETVALGRTHAQPALPIGFGLKIAGWLDETLRSAQRLQAMRPRVLTAQLHGGVGTMAGFGERAMELLPGFAERLGLTAPTLGWHVARDRVAEFVSSLAITAGSMGRIADEVRLLSRSEFGEIELGWHHGQVGSSTMPHKRNPEACEQAVVMARLASAMVNVALAAMSGDNERDSRALRLEWVCVPDVSHYTLSACEITSAIVQGMKVQEARIRENVRDVAEKVATERLMLTLGKHVGKQTAHEQVYELSQEAQSSGVSFEGLVRKHRIGELVASDLDSIFNPANYLGQSSELTWNVVREARKWLAAR